LLLIRIKLPDPLTNAIATSSILLYSRGTLTMPLSVKSGNRDRSWQDIVDEVRARIPHYTPEWRPAWNDLNESDPGMMLTQVFAHLAEMFCIACNAFPIWPT